MQNITETGLSTISNKIVETVLSNRVKKKSNPPPPHTHTHTHPLLPPPFKVGCLLISKGPRPACATLQGGYEGEKALFSALEVIKASESSFKEKCLN